MAPFEIRSSHADNDRKRKSSEDAAQEPTKKKTKITDCLANPSSTPPRKKEKKEKKEKKQHIPSSADAVQHTDVRKPEAKHNAVSRREKQIGGGAFDHEPDELRREEKQLKEMVKAEATKDEAEGEFGIKLSHRNAIIPKKKMEKYMAKAAIKGMTIKNYLERHEIKKAKKVVKAPSHTIKTSGTDDMADSVDLPVQSVTTTSPSAKKTLTSPTISNSKHAHLSAGPIIHTISDSHFNSRNSPSAGRTFTINTGIESNQSSPELPLIWHPDMLGDRRVKDLSKEERKARREWMRERRDLKHAAAGKKVMSMKERQKRRAQKKMKQRGRFVAKILQGKPRNDATMEDLMIARKKAKRIQRELKKEKRNKVIHRDKAGGKLRSTLGGEIG